MKLLLLLLTLSGCAGTIQCEPGFSCDVDEDVVESCSNDFIVKANCRF